MAETPTIPQQAKKAAVEVEVVVATAAGAEVAATEMAEVLALAAVAMMGKMKTYHYAHRKHTERRGSVISSRTALNVPQQKIKPCMISRLSNSPDTVPEVNTITNTDCDISTYNERHEDGQSSNCAPMEATNTGL